MRQRYTPAVLALSLALSGCFANPTPHPNTADTGQTLADATSGGGDGTTSVDTSLPPGPDATATPDIALPDLGTESDAAPAPDVFFDAAADASSGDAAADAVADAPPGDVPVSDSVDAGVGDGSGPDATVDGGSDGSTTPDAVPDAVPDGVADATPDAVPDAQPDGSATPFPNGYTYSSTCSLPADPSASENSVAIVEAFPNLNTDSFGGAVLLTHAGDGTNRNFVVTLGGVIYVFDNDPAVSSFGTFLDLSGVVAAGGEGGLLGLAFHPDYASNGYFYVNYTDYGGTGGDFRTVIARYQVSSGNPDQADAGSEVEIMSIDQPDWNHNGGMIAFGHDGLLYIGMGDGGGGGDTYNHGQNLESHHAAMLRIDVDQQDAGLQYAIPPDNPFYGDADPDIKQEIWAWGLRNPWRFSFDRLTGDLWAADVGQNAWEEVDIIEGGKNYGWPIMEGTHCYPAWQSNCDQTGLTLPVAEYPHSQGNSITGGYVYRGSKVPSLYGSYIYADYGTEALWLFNYGAVAPPTQPDGNVGMPVAGFGEDEQGEVYLMNVWSGGIYTFEETTPPPPVDFPQTLTETGCFSDVANLVPAEGVLGYTVNSPLWSDGADKERFMVLPQGGQLTYSDTGKWETPDGTLFIKHFSVLTDANDPASSKRLETRFMVKEASGVRGYTYRWNAAGTEATLIDGAETETFQRTLPGGETIQYTWEYPSRLQCRNCHTSVSGGVLGIETGQLNADWQYPGGSFNQLTALEDAGLLDAALPGAPDTLAQWYAAWTTADTTERARAWLDTNCAHCHQPNGPTGANLDLRYTTPVPSMSACNETPTKGDLGIAGATLVTPGDPATSVLYQRLIATDGPHAMPPLATSLSDPDGSQAVHDWILGLSDCN